MYLPDTFIIYITKYQCVKMTIVLFHSNFSPSGEQPEHHKLAHEL